MDVKMNTTNNYENLVGFEVHTGPQTVAFYTNLISRNAEEVTKISQV